jgi:ABC-type Fe3+/spermidine/putrescine transport system ATPase subunit
VALLEAVAPASSLSRGRAPANRRARCTSGQAARTTALAEALKDNVATVSEPASTDATPSSASPLLSIRNVAKSFGKNPVLRDISLQVAEGEFLTILGESGSGKTTLLRIIAGFESADSGEILMGGERLDNLPPYRRRVNTVFQHYALFPHLTVAENVGYGLKIAKLPKQEVATRVEQALDMVKMTVYAGSKPAKISGGQQQRIALARALVNRPRLLLLDEPLSALDANLRRQMQVELKSLQREVGISFVFVTHDQEEAMVMSDRIALVRTGELEQVASPREIYNCPATAYTAQFIGHTNLLSGEVKDGVARCHSLSWRTGLRDGPGLFSLRPENIRFAEGTGSGATVRIHGKILRQAFHGATELLQVECTDGLVLTVRCASRKNLQDDLDLEFSAADAVPVRQSQETGRSQTN